MASAYPTKVGNLMNFPVWAFPEAQKAVRDMERATNKQRWLESLNGQIARIDETFRKEEEAFFLEREHSDYPEWYDQIILNICRNHIVSDLLSKTNNEHVKKYIKQRTVQSINFPELPPRPKTPLDILIDKTLEGMSK